MPHVVSELKQELERQALNNWSDEAFGLIEPGLAACSVCCYMGSGGYPIEY